VPHYRPPAPPSSRFITPEGHIHLSTELDLLWRVERPRVTQAVSEAAAQGDRSENADYIYGKRRLREIDARVRFLRSRLEGMVIVSGKPSDPKRIFFGAWITLEDLQGIMGRHRIVGPDEFDLAPEHISMDSPLARALLGNTIDSNVIVETPTGSKEFRVVTVQY